LKEFKKEQQ